MNAITTKEKVVRQAISIIEKRVAKINDILGSNYLGEIIEVRKKAHALFEEYRGDLKNKEFQKRINELADKEKELKRKFKYQNKNWMSLIDEKVNIEFELSNLKNELYWIEHKKKESQNEAL